MADTTLILTQDTLTAADVAHIASLHPAQPEYRVLVPADTERNLISAIIDHLALGQVHRAWDEAVGEDLPDAGKAKAIADERLRASLAVLAAAGCQASGFVTDDDPLPALQRAVAAGGVREIVVVTYPHAVQDTFHRDWASRAREVLHVPVLHLYAGTSELG